MVVIRAPSVVRGNGQAILSCLEDTPDIGVLLPLQSLVELIKEGEMNPIAATRTSSGISHTLNPVLASHTGLYYCRVVLLSYRLDEPLVSESLRHNLTVISKFTTSIKISILIHFP